MKKLLQLSLLTYYKNWVMWLTIIGLEILRDIFDIYSNLFYYYDKQGNINQDKALEAIKGYGVGFDSSVTLISILLITYLVSTYYSTGIFKRFLFDGLTRYELVLFQLLISILAPVLIVIVGFLSTQILLLSYFGTVSFSFISYVEWDLLLLGILGSVVIIQFFMLFVNIFKNMLGLVIPLIITIADPIAAAYTRNVLKVDYDKYYPREVLNAIVSPTTLPELSILITGLILTVLILTSNAYLLINKNQ